MSEANETKQTKKPKAKGPIRTGVIVPTLIFVALVWAYFFFFFDGHVRRALEYGGTQMNGAEVNIGHVRTSFWRAELEIGNIQVTNAELPEKNSLQIGRMHWKMLWDALLRGKVVVDDASILDVAIGVPRAHPGRVIPKPPPSDKPSQFEKLKDQALKKTEEEFNKNVLGDVASLLKGTDPTAQLKNIEGELKSSLRVKELDAQLKVKQKEWKDRLDRLPQQKDIQALEAKIKTVKLDRFNNPQEVQQSIQQLDAIFKEADAKVKEVESTQKALSGDVGTYQNSLRELQAMVDQDVKDLENRVKLPKLDVQSLSKSIFGPMFLGRVKQAEFYMNKARDYMPPKKSATEKAEFKAPTTHERAKGRNYKFGHPRAYPLFWLRKSALSSKATAGADWSGDLTGMLQDVTDDPPLIGKPAVASFKGEFPKQQFYGVDGKITVDHVTEKPVEKLDLNIARFPVADRKLVDSPDVKMAMEGAAGSSSFNAEFAGADLKITSRSSFQKASPGAAAPSSAPGAPAATQKVFLKAEASQPVLADMLKGALAEIQKVDLTASVTGQWTDPKFDIDSNLGRDLAKAFEKQLQLKVAEAKAKLQNFINDQVGKQKEQLMAEFNKQKAMVDNLLKQKEAEINKAKGSIETAKNEAVKNQSKKLEQEGKKAVDDLKKKFGF